MSTNLGTNLVTASGIAKCSSLEVGFIALVPTRTLCKTMQGLTQEAKANKNREGAEHESSAFKSGIGPWHGAQVAPQCES